MKKCVKILKFVTTFKPFTSIPVDTLSLVYLLILVVVRTFRVALPLQVEVSKVTGKLGGPPGPPEPLSGG